MRRLTCPICHVSARDAAVDGSPCDPGDGQVRARPDYSETANSPSSDQSSCGISAWTMRGVARESLELQAEDYPALIK